MEMPEIGNEWSPTAHLNRGFLPPDSQQPMFCQVVSAFVQSSKPGRQGPKGMIWRRDGKVVHYKEALPQQHRSYVTNARVLDQPSAPREVFDVLRHRWQRDVDLINSGFTREEDAPPIEESLETLLKTPSLQPALKTLTKSILSHAVRKPKATGKKPKRRQHDQAAQRTIGRIRRLERDLVTLTRKQQDFNLHEATKLLIGSCRSVITVLQTKKLRIVECGRPGCHAVFVAPYLPVGGSYKQKCAAHP